MTKAVENDAVQRARASSYRSVSCHCIAYYYGNYDVIISMAQLEDLEKMTINKDYYPGMEYL